MRLYIAGEPVAARIWTAKADLEDAGYDVIDRRPNPAWAWRDQMRQALVDLADADGIATLPGWQSSPKASLEVHIARRLGLPVKPWLDWARTKVTT